MNYYLICFAVFCATYALNMFYITVLYHRGLAHESVKLSAFAKWIVVRTGSWVTGIDPKGWACLHRMHHQYSDTDRDPHSPVTHGVFGVAKYQVSSYENALAGLIRNRPLYTRVVDDLDFPVNWTNRNNMWWLPHVLHGAIALSFGFFGDMWLLGAAYWLGMMSHPVQGWMVNSFAHMYGYRNFETNDNSKNNTWVAWLVMGEGFQNNHHAHPNSPKFSQKWYEFDSGYVMCRIARKLGFISFEKVRNHA